MYYIRGGPNVRHYGQLFGSWEVVTEEGDLMCAFYGGMSMAVAVQTCKMLNKNPASFLNDFDYYEEHKWVAP